MAKSLMKERYIDLHMHSSFSSDGEFAPVQLVDRCKQAGIRIMSIADHNCAKANAEAQTAAAKAGIQYIPSIEIDCEYKDVNLHVLGYGIDFNSAEFEEIEQSIIRQEISASKKRLELIRGLGFELTETELETVSVCGYWKQIWTGEAFAEVLLGKPEYSDHELLKPYRSGGQRSDNPYVNFYWDYCSQGKKCYVPIKFPSLEETIATIHNNGGTAVLAHPGVNLAGRFDLLDVLIPLGLDGVEAGSSYHSGKTALDLYRWAQVNQLLATGGSDYHGKTKPAINLGEYSRFISEDKMETKLQEFGLVNR